MITVDDRWALLWNVLRVHECDISEEKVAGVPREEVDS